MLCYIVNYLLVLIIGIVIGYIIGYIFIKRSYTKITKIYNRDRKNMEDDYYYLIKGGDDSEISYLFTEEQMVVAKERAIRNPEDIN